MDTGTMALRPQSKAVARPALLSQLVRTVRQQQLFVPGQHVLVAVSGGPDSIALLALLHRLSRPWQLSLTVAHCNYGLRGVESEDDESFVKAFCLERQLPLVIHRPILTKQRQRSSIQETARNARYDFMKQLAQEVGADCIAVGHTANDQAETVLMWLMRGAGMTGLAGMAYVREDKIVRPLLAATREEVLTYLEYEGLTYRLDSSNEKSIYHRNRIRNELLPVMRRLAPAVVHVLQRQADVLRDEEQYLGYIINEAVQRLVSHDVSGTQRIDRLAFIELPVALQRRFVRTILRTYDGEGRASSLSVVESVRRVILGGKNESSLSLKQVSVMVNQREVRFCQGAGGSFYRQINSECEKGWLHTVHVPSTVYWARTNQQIHVQLMTRRAAEGLDRSATSGLAVFDADQFTERLVIRAWQAGDRFFPHGMQGKSKKLQDFFTDRKVARHTRSAVPLLVAPEGILWVVGVRQDERFTVRDATKRCLVVSVHNWVWEKE